MTDVLLELPGRIVTTSGEVALSYDALLDLARDGRRVAGLLALPDDRVARYNALVADPVATWDGRAGPAPTPRWPTPEPYASADLEAEAFREMDRRGLTSDAYLERAAWELEVVVGTPSEDQFRFLRWVVTEWRRREVVWGVGRGSSCASLLLFLFGLHRVDPVLHDVPATEFFR